MNVNQKGVRGLIKCLDDLHQRGYYSFPAFDDHSPVDVIAMDKSGRLVRLQVKYRSKDSHGYYQLCTQSVVNGKRVNINRDLIDGWAIFLEEDNKLLYIPVSYMQGKKTVNVNPSSDYGGLDTWRCG